MHTSLHAYRQTDRQTDRHHATHGWTSKEWNSQTEDPLDLNFWTDRRKHLPLQSVRPNRNLTADQSTDRTEPEPCQPGSETKSCNIL